MVILLVLATLLREPNTWASMPWHLLARKASMNLIDDAIGIEAPRLHLTKNTLTPFAVLRFNQKAGDF